MYVFTCFKLRHSMVMLIILLVFIILYYLNFYDFNKKKIKLNIGKPQKSAKILGRKIFYLNACKMKKLIFIVVSCYVYTLSNICKL